MTSNEIEAQIRYLLATEMNPWTLSDKLFGPTGLFGLLGPTLEERKRVGRSPIFKEAQKRIRELERQQAASFREEVRQLGRRPAKTS
ncbi:MAG: hypothetical protein FJ303_00540 [Planctomycetes bacterium]|nr:hypothetical protein [Planctomycetota bacterium]